jgi:outer membrane cobalamin receptor
MKKLSLVFGALVFVQANADDLPCGMAELVNLSPEELMMLKVSSSNKTSTCINQAPNTISSYSYKEIHALGARTLSDVLSLVAGVQIQINPNGRHRLWMRGVQSEFNNKVALYIDNVPIRDVFGGFPIDEEIPVENIEKVEIIRGPGSTLYGANAFSGVINVFTFQADGKRSDSSKTDNKLKNKLKLGIGENNTHFSYATVEQNLADVVDIKVDGKWLETDGRKPDYDRKGQINTRSNAQELAYLHTSIAALNGELLFNGVYSEFDNSRVDKPLPLQNNLTNKNLRFSLNYKHAFSDLLGLELNAYYTDTERLEHEIDDLANSSKDNSLFIPHTNLSGFYSDITYQPIESNQMIAGFEIKREEEASAGYINKYTGLFQNAVTNSDYQDLALMTYSVFLQDTQDILGKQTQFTAGLRFDALDLFHNQLSYRLGLTHSFDNGIYGKLLYGSAYRAPSFVEFTRAPLGTTLPDVETMKTLEAQIGYQSEKVRLSLVGYYNRYTDVLQRSNSFDVTSQVLGINSTIFGNFDHQTVIGSEFEVQITLDEHWKSFLNASWSKAKSGNAAQKLPLLADWTVAAGVEWREKIYRGDLVFNNQAIVYGQRKDWQDNLWASGKQQRYPNRNANLMDGFAVWNSSLHYNLPFAANTQALSFDLTTHNVLNTKYYIQSLVSPASNAIADFDTQYQGRQVRFSVSYSW